MSTQTSRCWVTPVRTYNVPTGVALYGDGLLARLTPSGRLIANKCFTNGTVLAFTVHLAMLAEGKSPVSHYYNLVRALKQLENLELGLPLSCPVPELVALCRALLAVDPADETAHGILTFVFEGSA